MARWRPLASHRFSEGHRKYRLIAGGSGLSLAEVLGGPTFRVRNVGLCGLVVV